MELNDKHPRQISLPPRLASVASLLTQGVGVADVGTDHGRLAVYLARNGCRPVIATDINPGPLDSARRFLELTGMEDSVELRLCVGLDAVSEEEVSQIAIAGMGGETIISILEAAPWTRSKRLVLQPMTKGELLRLFLLRNGYVIGHELLSREKERIYEILCVTGSAPASGRIEEYSPGELYVGKIAEKNDLYYTRIERTITRLRRAGKMDAAEDLERMRNDADSK